MSASSPKRRAVRKRLKSLIKEPFYRFYRYRLERHAKKYALPTHIGIIMDGNRRFAKAHRYANVGLGHRSGADKLYDLLDWVVKYGIKVVTVWGFALDNFKRPQDEQEALFDLFVEKFHEIADRPQIHRNQVKVQFIGEFERLPARVQAAIRYAEGRTAHYEKVTINFALAYGGREEVTEAFREYISAAGAAGKTPAEIAAEVTPEAVTPYLYTRGQPEPDLIIRTSGELRLSGFLLWQSVYSEFFFCDSFWPAFREIDFLRALREFSRRQRRFGR